MTIGERTVRGLGDDARGTASGLQRTELHLPRYMYLPSLLFTFLHEEESPGFMGRSVKIELAGRSGQAGVWSRGLVVVVVVVVPECCAI
ncbi:uncharacterized protein LAJ45_10574 [Morchella importuna]|uniref:uncharacterized protein n=1 Tax=Morchella importuna TaxID=1174673 RepID=UPI001E8EC848|nr:uncharacterized protein LAJ45_10574 [Morchella importuna]KAH8145452.1 hypothetical protein LAJ45_10574 [Morchella importuna]